MEYRRLGSSGLRISRIGLGTMTFGGMVGEKASLRQLDQALDGGINFIDTAEMYASPPTADSYGKSEKIIGKWLKTRPRDAVIIASKISGPAELFPQPHIRGGLTVFDRHHFSRAVEGSLKRLGTDYIDLYQLHWPDRKTPVADQLEAIERLIDAGKIRYFGANVETAWGLTKFATLAEERGLPRIASIQTGYNLLERDVDIATAETCELENIGFLAFSALAMGVLTGKYTSGKFPRGSRLADNALYREHWGYGASNVLAAADKYVAIARAADISPIDLAIAWLLSRPFVTAALSAATKARHLDALLKAAEVTLAADVSARIDAVHAESRLDLHP